LGDRLGKRLIEIFGEILAYMLDKRMGKNQTWKKWWYLGI
jgi:hypothetical protein